MSLDLALERYLPQIDAELKECIPGPSADKAAYYGMMRYHLGWADEALQPTLQPGGKRIRPMLCLLACWAAGGDPPQALPTACAVELVHSFSLVHDDIQDRSPTRRGRRSVWKIWGVAQAINAGDGLFVLARMAMHKLPERGVPLPLCQAACQALDRACLALCEGQYLDMTFEERPDVRLEEYLGMARRKTAALLAASAELGAIVAGADPRRVDLYRGFGEDLGMAFQIQDDVLGIWGDPQATGKSAATDLRYKKKTLPVLYALDAHGNRGGDPHLRELYLRGEPLGDADVQYAIGALDRVGARQYAEEQAEAYYRRALSSLAEAGAPSQGHVCLLELAASLLGRSA